jgi:hypothetical protein
LLVIPEGNLRLLLRLRLPLLLLLQWLLSLPLLSPLPFACHSRRESAFVVAFAVAVTAAAAGYPIHAVSLSVSSHEWDATTLNQPQSLGRCPLVVIPEEPALSEVEWGICVCHFPFSTSLPKRAAA